MVVFAVPRQVAVSLQLPLVVVAAVQHQMSAAWFADPGEGVEGVHNTGRHEASHWCDCSIH